jgi:hypothetical protein
MGLRKWPSGEPVRPEDIEEIPPPDMGRYEVCGTVPGGVGSLPEGVELIDPKKVWPNGMPPIIPIGPAKEAIRRASDADLERARRTPHAAGNAIDFYRPRPKRLWWLRRCRCSKPWGSHAQSCPRYHGLGFAGM